jgi:hypothetical protein
MGDGYRKAVGRSASTGGGGGAIAEASPGGDFRLQDQIRAAWNKGRPAAGDQKTNLFFQDAKQAVVAIRKKEVSEANAPQIAYNLGLIANSLDTNAREAMKILTDAALDRPVKVGNDEHDRLIREAAAALEEMDARIDEHEQQEKQVMSPEDWKAEVARRRESVRAAHKNKAQNIKSLRLIPAQAAPGPVAFTGNGINPPEQGAGQDESNDADLLRQTEHANRASDTWQTDNGNEPIQDGAGAPSRHSSLTRVQQLEKELEAARIEAARETGLEKLIGRLKTASLTPDQIDGLHAYIDQLGNKDLYSEAHLDSVASGLEDSFDDVVVSDEDIAAYLNKTGRTE